MIGRLVRIIRFFTSFVTYFVIERALNGIRCKIYRLFFHIQRLRSKKKNERESEWDEI